jgi:hypothetical protein
MAKEVIKAGKLTVGGVDLTDHVTQVTMEDNADEVETTSLAGTGYRTFMQGLKVAKITPTFQSDHAAASVQATLQPIYDNAGTTAIKVWPSAAGTVVYTIEPAQIFQKPLWGGGIGDLATTDVTFTAAGTTGVTRGTA